MASDVIAIFRFKASEAEDPEAVLSYLTGLEDQLMAIQFAEAEWSVIHQTLMEDFLPFLARHAGDKSHAQILVKAMDLFSLNVINDKLEEAQWHEFYKLAFKMFRTSGVNRARISGLELIQTLVRTKPQTKFDADKLVKSIFGILSQSAKSSPTLVQSLNITLGIICECMGEKVSHHAKTVKRMLMSQLNEQINSKAAKVDMSIIDGCLRGLDSCLMAFPMNVPDEKDHKTQLYDALIKCSPLPEGNLRERRLQRRSALHLFARHCPTWSDELVQLSECKHWYITLKEWSESPNSEDHKLGWKCLVAFLDTISGKFDEGHEASFDYLLRTFTGIIRSNTRQKEVVLAILGYGSLAGACKLFKGPGELAKMLSELVGKTCEAVNDTSEMSIHFPSHLTAISKILAVVESVPVDIKMEVECLLVNMIKNYPSLPPQYRPFAHEAFKRTSKFVGLNNVVFQGIIHSCSFPILIASDVADVVSTKSFLPFWQDVVEDENANNAFIQAILDIIDKLNFDTDAYKVVINDNNQIVQETLEGTLTQIIKEQAQPDWTTGILVQNSRKPKVSKDFTILANLVILFQMKLRRENWISQCLKSVMIKSTQYPELSGFYSMLSVTLESIPDGFFQGPQLDTCSKYLKEVLEKSLSFQHELLKAVLSLIVKLPLNLVQVLLDSLPKPVARVFKQGHLDLVDKTLDALAAWTKDLGLDAMKPLFEQVIPCMKAFLDEEQSDLWEEEELVRVKKKKTIVSIADETEQEKVQRKILIMFGQLSSDLHYLLLPTEDEQSAAATAWDLERKLAFEVPFPDVRVNIFLDDLLPRIIELSLNAKQRRTRVAAAEAFYSITVYMIGKDATQPAGSPSFSKLNKKLFPVMLKLAGDEDSVIGPGLFDKLMMQTVHWYSGKGHPDGAAVLVDSILDGLSCIDDPRLIITSKRMLFEYLKWSIKQAAANKAVKILITRLYSMWVHPDDRLRQAASVALCSFYTLFREEDDLVEAFTIEMFVHVMHSIVLSHPSVCQESKDCINHLLRIIKQKRHLFEKESNLRRIPRDFAFGSNGAVKDLIDWLIPWTMKTETEARHHAMEVVYSLATDIRKSVANHINELLHHVNTFHGDIDDYMGSLELAFWLVNQRVVDATEICVGDQLASELMDQEPKNSTLIVRYLDWLTLKPSLAADDIKLIEMALLCPSKLGFDPRSQLKLRDFMVPIVKRIPLECLFEANFSQACSSFTKGLLTTELLETLQCLNFLKTRQKIMRLDFDINAVISVLMTSSSPHSDICMEMIDLVSFLSSKVLLMLADMPAILQLYENCIFTNMLSWNVEEVIANVRLPLMVRLARFASSFKAKEVSVKFAQLAVKFWDKFTDTHQPKLCIYLCKYLAMISSQDVMNHSRIGDWFCSEVLSSAGTPIKVKAEALVLLPVFLKNVNIRAALKALQKQHFPLKSREDLVMGTTEYNDYTSVFERLCNTLEGSGTEIVFDIFLTTVCREDDHICKDLVTASVEKCPNKLNLLKEAFSNILKNDSEKKCEFNLRICSSLIIPLLRGSCKQILLDFFPDVMQQLIEWSKEHLMIGNEVENKRVLANRIVAFKMMAELYAICPKELVHSKPSKITKAAYECLKGAEYHGKELSQFLVKHLKKIRTESMIGSSDTLNDLFRKMQCEALNTMISVISCIQDQEKMYYSFLFKEDEKNGEYIWQRIVDVLTPFAFSIELSEIPVKRKVVAAVRKSETCDTGAPAHRVSHFLSDSSLSQDVNSYDFHESLVSRTIETEEEVKIEENIVPHFHVELEQDHFGEHECMPSLIALINHMFVSKIFKLNDTLPDWIASIRERIKSAGTHANVKLFLLKLILNCSSVFQNYASHLTVDILRVVLAQQTWQGSPLINYFSLDIIAMLLSWSGTSTNSVTMKTLASNLFEALAQAASESREIAKYILEIISLMCQKWKPSITINYHCIHRLFTSSDELVCNFGIQLLGVLISSGLPPYEDSVSLSIEKYFQGLSLQMNTNHKKEIYQAAAEVLGMSLEYFKENNLDKKCDVVFDIACMQLEMLTRLSPKFLHCLYMAHLHFPNIMCKFAKYIMYSLPQIQKGEPLKQAIAMFGGAVPFFMENVKHGEKWESEINTSKIRHFMMGEGNVDCQLAALDSMEKAARAFVATSLKSTQAFLNDLAVLSHHVNVKVRFKVFSILTWMTSEKVDGVEDLLLKGLGDPDPSISSVVKELVKVHWLDDDNLTSIEKIFVLLQKGLRRDTEAQFLGIFGDLMLRLLEKGSEYSRKLFSQPLDKCANFVKADINTSWKSQYEAGVLTPLYAETLSSQQNLTQFSYTPQLRATQPNGVLDFAPTQGGTMEEQRPLQKQFLSSLYDSGQFKVDNKLDGNFGAVSSAKNEIQIDVNDMGRVRVGKRFEAKRNQNHMELQERTKAKFSKLHQRRMTKQELIEREKQGRKQAQVTLMRSYRLGDLPDIEITTADLVKPMQTLCLKDSQFARKMSSLILSDILANHKDQKTDQFAKQLAEALMRGKSSNKNLTAGLLEPFLRDVGSIQAYLDPEYITEACMGCDLQVLGILALEQFHHPQLKQVQEPPTKKLKGEPNVTMPLIELYKSIGDHSSANGLYLQQSQLNDKAVEALNLEALGKLKSAKKKYIELTEKSVSQTERKLWLDCCIDAMEKLSLWKEIDEIVDEKWPQGVAHSKWSQTFLLPRYISSLHHLQIENNSQKLFEFCKSASEDVLASLAHERALLFFTKGKLAESNLLELRKLNECLQMWSSRNVMDIQSQKKIIHSLQRTALFFERDNLQEICHLLDEDLQAADHLMADWKLIKGKYDNSALLKMCDISIQQKLCNVAIRMLDLGKKFNKTEHYLACEVKATVCKSLDTESSLDFHTRFGALYRKFIVVEKHFQADILHGLAMLLKKTSLDENLEIANLLTILSEKAEKVEHFKKMLQDAGEVETMDDLIYFFEDKSINMKLEQASKLSCQELFSIAEFAYSLLKDFPDKACESMATIAIKVHGSCMKQGCNKAINLFPKLLLLMEGLAKDGSFTDVFQESMRGVPAWTLLTWSSQLLSLLHSEVMKKVVQPLVIMLAQAYPQALWFSYNFVRQDVKTKSQHLNELLEMPIHVKKLVSEFEQVASLEVVTADFIKKCQKYANDGPKVKHLYVDFKKSHYDTTQRNAKKLFFNDKVKRLLDELAKNPSRKKDWSKSLMECFPKNQYPKVTHLGDFSSFLANFMKTSLADSMEIPGQYDACKSEPNNLVKIAAFKPVITTFSSIRRPIKISIVGDNGKTYDYIIKFGEDIRQDQRIQQVFRVCSQFFESPMVTYNVIPINHSLGLLQFVPNTSTLKQLVKMGPNDDFGVRFENLHRHFKAGPERNRAKFDDAVKGGKHRLREAFLKMSSSYEGFFFLRSNFMVSHAQVCIVGYILGIGDRHGENMLISLQSGKSIAIDFGYSFGSAFLLAIAEMVPFRFTPQIQGLMAPFKSEGPFKDTMIKCLQKLRDHEDILISTLSIFIKEPTLDWINESCQVKDNSEDFANKRIVTVKEKLYYHPGVMINEQIQSYYKHAVFKPAMSELVLKGQKDEKVQINEDVIVSKLIDLATDGAILSSLYFGWAPHI